MHSFIIFKIDVFLVSLEKVLPNKNASEFQSCLDLRSYRSWISISFTRNSNGEGDIKELIRYNFYRCKWALTNPEIYTKIHYHWERLKPNFNLMINFFSLKLDQLKVLFPDGRVNFKTDLLKIEKLSEFPFKKFQNFVATFASICTKTNLLQFLMQSCCNLF